MGTEVAETVARSVRAAIEASGYSVFTASKATRIPYTTLDRKLHFGGKFTVEDLYVIGCLTGRPPASFFGQDAA